ncbi:MAG TPA: type IVB secretion system protein IcmH/DotU [Steroidobacteraceae bacterium]|nr:type IVB secretion system protein IcmH/DotU [Steroidobacteraceae bacterium]
MGKDNNDDPFAPRDATIFRPRPGAGKRGAEPPPPAQDPRPSMPAPEPRAPPAARAPLTLAGLRDFSAAGLNPLVQAASPLLILTGRLRSMLSYPDIAALRRQALDQVRGFEERARAAGIAPETVLAARYVLCAAVDEAVLSTPWGSQSEWGAQTLLVMLHRETWGGEKFFDMLQRISADPGRHIELMELQYVCLALGFEGKYHVADRGHARLAEVESELFRRIRTFRGVPAPELSLNWRGMQDRRNPVIRYVPWWVIGAFTLVVLAGTFILFHLRLAALSTPIDDQLAHIGLAEPPPAAAPVTARPSAAPRLMQLLSEDVANHVLSVEERNNQTLVTLIAADLFASGSAKVNPKYYMTLQRLAHALNEVPGRVFVVGHTDDQPVRSLQYRDNYDLSRARANEVVKLLSLAIDNPARLEPSGVGSSEPRYKPESLPENRARNRRVEIIHVGEG